MKQLKPARWVLLAAIVGSALLALKGEPRKRAPEARPTAALHRDVDATEVPAHSAGTDAAPRPEAPSLLVPNTGRWDADVRWVRIDGRAALFFTDGGMTLAAVKDGRELALRSEMVGATPEAPVIDGATGGVLYRSAWPGIDVLYEPAAKGVEYTLFVHAGADPSAARFRYDGADSVDGSLDGGLSLRTEMGSLSESAPIAYVNDPGGRRPVASRVVAEGGGAHHFEIEGWDGLGTLVIDPILSYATLLGGGGHGLGGWIASELAAGVAIGEDGSIFVAGSCGTAFPVTGGAVNRVGKGNGEAYVACLSADGTTLLWSTLLSSSQTDGAMAITVDGRRGVIVAGTTRMAWDFPLTPGAYDTTSHGEEDVFVARLDQADGALYWSTILGGSKMDRPVGVVTDADGSVYVAGVTASTNFPVTAGAFDTTANGDEDGFVSKLSWDGKLLLWSTYLGGAGLESMAGIGLDPSGNVCFAGTSESANFPATPGAFDGANDALYFDAFIGKLNPSGTSRIWMTYLGGEVYDWCTSMAVDARGAIAVAGRTQSSHFPCTANAFSKRPLDSVGAWVAMVAPDGQTLEWATYAYGSEFAQVAIESDGSVVLAACVGSYVQVPATPGTFQATTSGDLDICMMRFDQGGGLAWMTYLGGRGQDIGHDLAIDRDGSILVAGRSFYGGFPVTVGAYDTSWNSDCDAIVARVAPDASALRWSTYLGESQIDTGVGVVTDDAGNVYLTGATECPDFPRTAGLGIAGAAGGFDVYVTKIVPGEPAPAWSIVLGGAYDDQPAGIAIDAAGNLYVSGTTCSGDFQTLPVQPAPDKVGRDGPQAFLLSVDPTGHLRWSQRFGYGYMQSVSANRAGDVAFGGWTGSTGLKTTPGAQQSRPVDSRDAFAGKVKGSTGEVVWLTYVGGNNTEEVMKVAMDPNGHVIAAGTTGSTNFPILGGHSFQPQRTGDLDGFVARFDDAGKLLWSTYLGGSNQEYLVELALDAEGRIYVTGHTVSANFPAVGLEAGARKGATFVTRMAPDGSAVDWSVFLGGKEYEWVHGLAVGTNGAVYVCGMTSSNDFPILGGTDADKFHGWKDAFYARFDADSGRLRTSLCIGSSLEETGMALAYSASGKVTFIGTTSSPDFRWTDGGTSWSGGTDAFVMQFESVRATEVTTSMPDGTYVPGDAILLQLKFLKPVLVGGVPRLRLRVGAATAEADYIAGSGSDTLEFRMDVKEGQHALRLDIAGTDALDLSAGAITDMSGDYVVTRLPKPGEIGSIAREHRLFIEGTPPVGGRVQEGDGPDVDQQKDPTTITARWSGFEDPDTGIAGYEWAIGSAPGRDDVMPFTATGLETNATATGLAMQEGPTWYVSVRARNGAGLVTLVASDGIRFDLGGSAGPAKACGGSAGGGASLALLLAAAAVACRRR